MIETLFSELSALDAVEAIALGGSRAGTSFDEKSDYDVYVYCTAPIAEALRREILSKYCSVMEIGNHFWEYEDNCQLHNGVDIDLLYRELDTFTDGVAEVVELHQAHNGYTTCMWHNLKSCKIIFDRNGRLADAKKRFDVPYPEALRENIIRRNFALLSNAMPAYPHQIEKAVLRGDRVSVLHRTTAFLESYFDIVFALNRLTDPGEKRLIALCKANCTILPDQFEENLNQLFENLYHDPASISRNIQSIVTELKKAMDKA